MAKQNGATAARSLSFNGRDSVLAEKLRRPKTVPDLRNGVLLAERNAVERPKLTKVLLNVTVQGSVGPVQVLISPELKVKDLISAALKQYLKEGRRPVICTGVEELDLHYSQFSLESLDREEKIAALGSRNFFLCKRKVVADGVSNGGAQTTSSSSCLKQAEKAAKLVTPCPWLKFMSFLF